MNPQDMNAPSTDQILVTIRRELSTRRRWLHRLVLVAAGIVVAAILSLWLTEPQPLPLRTHVAFGMMTLIGAGWIAVSAWILTRRNCPTVVDRLASAWMAAIASALFLAVGASIALLRGEPRAATTVALVGAICLAAALHLLRQAYALRAALQGKRAQLISQMKQESDL